MKQNLMPTRDDTSAISLDESADFQLSQVPSTFAQCVFLNLLRSDRKRAARVLFGLDMWTDDCERLLNDLHLRAFRRWLGLDLREKQRDLQPYLDTLAYEGAFPPPVRFLQFCRDIAPMEASLNETKLFLASVEVLAKLDRNAASQRCRRRTVRRLAGDD